MAVALLAAGAKDVKVPSVQDAFRELDEALVAVPTKRDTRHQVVLEALGVHGGQ